MWPSDLILTFFKLWYFSKNNEIRRDDYCVDYPGGNGGKNKPDQIITYPCHGERGNQEWQYMKNQQIKHTLSGYCIELNQKNKLIMNDCDSNSERQKWYWKENV